MFRQAYSITMGHEGHYSNHPNDTGGETWKGISRVHHPNWEGWKIVDQYNIHALLKHNSSLEIQVKNFYKKNYWNNSKLNLELLSEKFPQVACELFDIAVNMGVKRAAKFLQRSVNLLNRDEKKYNNLKVDGFCGNKTFHVIDKYISNERYLRKLIVLIKAKFYIDIAEKTESQEAFIRGWINRVNL